MFVFNKWLGALLLAVEGQLSRDVGGVEGVSARQRLERQIQRAVRVIRRPGPLGHGDGRTTDISFCFSSCSDTGLGLG